MVPGEVVLVRRAIVETTGLRVRDANLTTLERVGGVAHQRHAAHLRIRVLAGCVGILEGVAQVARLERGLARVGKDTSGVIHRRLRMLQTRSELQLGRGAHGSGRARHLHCARIPITDPICAGIWLGLFMSHRPPPARLAGIADVATRCSPPTTTSDRRHRTVHVTPSSSMMLATSLARAVRPATLRGAGFAGRALPAPRVTRPTAMTRQFAAAASSNPIAVFDTSMGTFEAELLMDRMPITASNFVDLANTGFYDGLHFHRVIDGCVFPRSVSY